MRRLFYAGGQILVDDRTCKAVLRYSRALAVAAQSDVVSVPIFVDGGGSAYAHLLLGPASQIYSVPVTGPENEPYDETMVAELEKRTHELHPSVPAWPDEMLDVPNLDVDFDVFPP